MSEASRSTLDETQPNAFNVDAKVDFPADLLSKPTMTKAILAHLMMAREPSEHYEEFKTEVLENPTDIPKLLGRSNYDGVRWECLSAMQDSLQKDPDFFKKPGMNKSLQAVREVAAEKLPFTDSPSYFARQILNELGHSDNGSAQGLSFVSGISGFRPG